MKRNLLARLERAERCSAASTLDATHCFESVRAFGSYKNYRKFLDEFLDPALPDHLTGARRWAWRKHCDQGQVEDLMREEGVPSRRSMPFLGLLSEEQKDEAQAILALSDPWPEHLFASWQRFAAAAEYGPTAEPKKSSAEV